MFVAFNVLKEERIRQEEQRREYKKREEEQKIEGKRRAKVMAIRKSKQPLDEMGFRTRFPESDVFLWNVCSVLLCLSN